MAASNPSLQWLHKEVVAGRVPAHRIGTYYKVDRPMRDVRLGREWRVDRNDLTCLWRGGRPNSF